MRVICFVLEQRDHEELALMWIDSYPCPGFWVHPGVDDRPRYLSFLPPVSFGGVRGKLGQGELILRTVDPVSTDPVLHGQPLQGGFIINTEIRPTTLRFNARLQLSSASVLPFVLSPEDMARMCRAGEQDVVDAMRLDRIELGVWYRTDFVTTSDPLAKGVVRFTECSSSGEAVGEVIVVSASKLVPKDISGLSRFGQAIGRLVTSFVSA